MKALLTASVLSLATGPIAAYENDLYQYIVEQAADCWTSTEALRGITIASTLDIRFRRDGTVASVQVVSVSPDTAVSRALSSEMASALARCGPYITEGMLDISLTMKWPL